ncbi:hypothetical protein LXA43DRAFT_143628 [Ganoderma leucocontextum]|nr:hypothetical protein LXA43DRAFT_143628 [Ganoderma leucocontextum]
MTPRGRSQPLGDRGRGPNSQGGRRPKRGGPPSRTVDGACPTLLDSLLYPTPPSLTCCTLVDWPVIVSYCLAFSISFSLSTTLGLWAASDITEPTVMMPTPTATLANVATDATHLSHPGDIPIDPALLSETAAQAQAAVHQPGDLSVPRLPPETPCTGRPPDVHGPETASTQPGAGDELPPLISSTEDAGIKPPVNGSGERVQRAEFEQL